MRISSFRGADCTGLALFSSSFGAAPCYAFAPLRAPNLFFTTLTKYVIGIFAEHLVCWSSFFVGDLSTFLCVLGIRAPALGGAHLPCFGGLCCFLRLCSKIPTTGGRLNQHCQGTKRTYLWLKCNKVYCPG